MLARQLAASARATACRAPSRCVAPPLAGLRAFPGCILPTRCLRAFSVAPPSPNAGGATSGDVSKPAETSAGGSFAQTIRKVLAAASVAREEKAKDAKKDGATPLNAVSLRRLWEFAKPEIVPLGVSVGTLGITTAISLLFPYAIGQILDVALNPAASLTPTSISLALLGLFVVQSGMITLRSALLTIAGERIAASIRKDLFNSTVAQETAWFDTHRTGDIVNRLSSDTAVLQKALTTNISNGLRSSAMVIGGAGMLFYLSPHLALLSLGLIPPVALAGMYYGRYLQGQQKAVQEALGKTTNIAEEIISAIRTVRQFAREGGEAARFGAKVNDAYAQAKHIGVVAAYFDGLVHMAANISLIAVLWYGGHQVWTHEMSAGDLTAFLMYSLYTGFNVSSLSSVYTELKRAAGAAARITEITDRTPAIPIAGTPGVWQELPAFPDSHGLLHRGPSKHPIAVASAVASGLESATVQGDIAFRDVAFWYPSRPETRILDGLNLSIPAGQHVAVVGRSGSGKSTLGALLTRLYDPEEGVILVDGRDIKSIDPIALRHAIGVVSQEPTLLAASIIDNIRFGNPTASVEEVEEAAVLANVHRDITGLSKGYHTIVGERGAQLSGGQKQRIAIARALIKRPSILVLDEATSALDAHAEQSIMQALRSLQPRPTIITIAHRFSTMQHANEVAVLDGGKIVEKGGFQKLQHDEGSIFRQFIQQQVVRNT